jgi:nucleotide-binding universal stress UspA family protein
MIYGDPNEPDDATMSFGPTVLIAVDGGAMSDLVVRTAHRLFGETATYLAINVGPGPYTQMNWAYVWPAAGPSTAMPATWLDDVVDRAVDAATQRASAEAGAVTRGAGLAQATPLGDVGDPPAAIIRAAHHHHADVVVIGPDARSWLSRLVDGSVERSLLNEPDVSVLVVSSVSDAGQ